MAGLRIVAFSAIGLVAAAGCNALTQNPDDRYVDAGSTELVDSGTKKAKEAGPTTMDATVDATVDSGSGVPTITISTSRPDGWTSPNQAVFLADGSGTKITAQGPAPAGNHAVLFPNPVPELHTSDYKLTATIIANEKAEFGIITRVNSLGSGFLFGSRLSYDTANSEPFAATIAPADWNPSTPEQLDGGADIYQFAVGSTYVMELDAHGDTIDARMWLSSLPRPDAALVINDPTSADQRGKGVGYYVYFATGSAPNVTLTSFVITYAN
jgi:hypothetical protein